MNKEPRNLATYKEFGKMLRAVADIYSQMGDTPLEEEGWEERKYPMQSTSSPTNMILRTSFSRGKMLFYATQLT